MVDESNPEQESFAEAAITLKIPVERLHFLNKNKNQF